MASLFRRKGKPGWIVQYTGPDGRRKTRYGGRDKTVAQALARELEHEALLRRKGIIDGDADRLAEQARRPLSEHVDDYEKHLRDSNASPKHIAAVIPRLRAIVAGCGFERWPDITATRVTGFLADLRSKGLRGLGLSKYAPKSKMPSIQTANYYLRAIKQFSSWMLRNGRAAANPVAHLRPGNADTDRRHLRRAFTADELRRLVDAARNGPDWNGIPGPERALVYRLAAEAGLRVNEIRSLTVGAFDLTGDPPTARVPAAFSKHRRQDVQPLPAGLAAELREHFAGKLPAAAAFRLPAAVDAADMLRRDLAAARAAWVTEADGNEAEYKRRAESDFLAYVDAAGRFADFHALRHTFISNLASGGVHPKLAQQLARHSSIVLTMDRYSHSLLTDRASALRVLPDLTAKPLRQERADGTYDVRAHAPDDAGSALQKAQHSPAPNGHHVPSTATNVGKGTRSESEQKPVELSALAHTGHQLPSTRRAELEPAHFGFGGHRKGVRPSDYRMEYRLSD